MTAIKLPAADFRRQAAEWVGELPAHKKGFQTGSPLPTAWTMTAAQRDVALAIRLPQEPHLPRRAHGFRRKYHRPFRVVSKCALREKEKATDSRSLIKIIGLV